MWPEPVPLRDKLYGKLEELRRTAAFARVTSTSCLVHEEEEDLYNMKANRKASCFRELPKSQCLWVIGRKPLEPLWPRQ